MSPELIYTLHCSGCHKLDGSGQNGFVPTFDKIGGFARLPEGRDYLIRVPGVSQSELGGEDLTRLMNWLIRTYGANSGLSWFQPYTVAEVQRLRREPASNASGLRSELVATLEGSAPETPENVAGEVGGSAVLAAAPVVPPGSFALCAACHSTSSSGAHSMGPNLRGVLGRKSGSAEGFGYSKSMLDSEFVWDVERLDAFLEAPRSVVPNTSMVFGGEPDAARRQAIIEYLQTLR